MSHRSDSSLLDIYLFVIGNYVWNVYEKETQWNQQI